jgi:hypothetical protein
MAVSTGRARDLREPLPCIAPSTTAVVNGFVSEELHHPDASVATVLLTDTSAPTAIELERLVARRALGIGNILPVAIEASALREFAGQCERRSARPRVFTDNSTRLLVAPSHRQATLRTPRDLPRRHLIPLGLASMLVQALRYSRLHPGSAIPPRTRGPPVPHDSG